jgi:hypothetical protein
MAVRRDHRSKGFGRRLLDALIQTARADGFPALSLSVSPLNCARQLYEFMGFRKIGESGTSWTLLLSLSPSRAPTELTNKSPEHQVTGDSGGIQGENLRSQAVGKLQ